jgi:hypothetical protein
MSHSGDDRLTVAADLMAEPCLWRWEIRDPKRDEVVASSWTDEWMAYESPDEALRAAGVRLNSMSCSSTHTRPVGVTDGAKAVHEG